MPRLWKSLVAFLALFLMLLPYLQCMKGRRAVSWEDRMMASLGSLVCARILTVCVVYVVLSMGVCQCACDGLYLPRYLPGPKGGLVGCFVLVALGTEPSPWQAHC